MDRTIIFAPLLLAQLSMPNERTWNHFIGPWGGYAFSVAMLLFFIQVARMQNRKMEVRAAREEEAKERRHNELVATNASNSAALLAISVESARVTMMATVSSEKVAERLKTLNRIIATHPCILTCRSELRRIIENAEIEESSGEPLRKGDGEG